MVNPYSSNDPVPQPQKKRDEKSWKVGSVVVLLMSGFVGSVSVSAILLAFVPFQFLQPPLLLAILSLGTGTLRFPPSQNAALARAEPT